MALTLSCDHIRRLDADAVAELGIPSLLLMENAARGAAELVHRKGLWKSITIFCGPGNNGGDGLALARLLASDGLEVDTFLIRNEKSLSKDAQVNFDLLMRTGCRVREVDHDVIMRVLHESSSSDLVVDAIMGTGVRGEVRAPWIDIISDINSSSATVLSLDVPSGLDCDSGQPCGTAITADFTVTFAAMKKGFLKPDAQPFVGETHVAHIGLPAKWMDSWYLRISQSTG